ncbi:hypothetical protein Tco_1154161, partial [Tanacetum coccineum]
IQALVDGKKVIVTETSVRRALHLKDVEGAYCLPTATIFAELERMGYEKLTQKLTFYKAFYSPQWKFLIHTILQLLSAKTTVWNEFSSTMASDIICIATNQKLNFSKYIFDNMVKNLEGGVIFLMYPRFVQVFLDKQFEGMSKHKETYATPSHSKKVFANMKREGKGFSGNDTPLFATMMVQASDEEGEGSAIPTNPYPTITQPSSSQPQQKQQPRRKQRKGTEIPLSSGEPIADEVTTEEHEPTYSNDPLLSGEDRVQLTELMNLCTNLQKKVLDLEESKTAQVKEIVGLKQRVKQLEKRKKSRTLELKRIRKVGSARRVEFSDDANLGAQEDASKQGRKIADIDQDAEVTLIDETRERFDADEDIYQVFVEHVDASGGKKVEQSEPVAEKKVSIVDLVISAGEVVTTASVEVTTASATTTTVDELTLAQTLMEIKAAKPKAITTAATTVTLASTKPKAKGIIFHDQEEQAHASTTIGSPSQPSQVKDNGKAKMIEEEPVKKTKIQEANIAWDDIQAKVETDYELALRLKSEEQEKMSIEEKDKLFQELLEKRRKFFAAKRAEEKRNKPPTKAQQRSYMSTYLKNMAGWRHKDLKNKSFAEVHKLFDKEMKMSTKKQKLVDDDKEEEELKQCFELVLDEEVAIDAILLATKPLVIVDWKIIRERKMGYYQLIRADESSKRYSSIIQMLQNIDRENLETLWKLVKAKHGDTRPEEGYERVL